MAADRARLKVTVAERKVPAGTAEEGTMSMMCPYGYEVSKMSS